MGSDSPATSAVEAMELRLDESLHCVWSNADGVGPLGLSASSPIGKYFPELLVSSQGPMIIETLHGVVENWVGAVIVACFDHEDTSRWLELKVRRVDPGETDGAALEIEVREIVDRIGDENIHSETLATGNPINEFATSVAGSADLLVGSDLLGSVHPEDRRRVSQFFGPGAHSRRQGTLVYRAQN